MSVFKYIFLLRYTCLSAFALVMVEPLPLFAESGAEDFNYSSPAVPKDPNLAKVTMFRLCYVGGASSPEITLVREPQGHSPVVLDSHLAGGTISPYFPFKPGRSHLHILDGKVVAPQNSTEKLPLKEKKLVDPLDVTFAPGSYVSLIVSEQKGALSARLITDERPAEGSSPAMRVEDLSGLDQWRVDQVDERDRIVRELWDSTRAAGDTAVPLPGAGVYRIRVQRKINGEMSTKGYFVAKLAAASSFTILLYPGWNDQGASKLLFDAAPGQFYNPAAVQAVASESSVNP